MSAHTGSACGHIPEVDVTKHPNPNGGEECLQAGKTWVHLRVCLSCGHVGCCDSSQGKHATKHYHRSKHPMTRSLERGEDWAWCYVDEVLFDDVSANR